MLKIVDLRTNLFGPISISVEAGECIAVLGPSGSGKSLFLRAVVDLDPNEGQVSLGADRREGMPANLWRKLVSLVPAESGWWSEHVADHFTRSRDLTAMLASIGLPDALDWQVSRLSSGEKHRLSIVRALCLSPKALLLDEPTAALDDAATESVEALIQAQCRQGVAVILVTHDHAQAERLATSRFLMSRGALQLDGGLTA